MRPDPLLLDAPLLAVHWPKLLLWVPFQASINYDFIKQMIGDPLGCCLRVKVHY